MALGLAEILIAATVFLIYIYHRLTRKFDFWSKRGVVGPKPLPFFGNFKDVMLRKNHLADHLKAIYDAYPGEPAIGLFLRSSPILLVKDLEMIKDIMIKNFPSFADRGVKTYGDVDPLSQHLVFLEPKRWKPMRKRLTPTFSSGKLKEMFYLIMECADHFEKYLEKMAVKGEYLECREATAKFTTDVIGMCAFGLNMNSMMDDDSEFRRIGRMLTQSSFRNWLRRSLRTIPHWMARLIKPLIYEKEIVPFFVNTVKQTMEYRVKNGVRRNDFIDLLMDMKNDPKEIGEEEITDMILTAQAFVFFVAGFETSSITITHALYELAKNSDIQEKLREEIEITLKNNNGKLSYDCVKDMKYLDKVFKETLRMYPPAAQLTRKSLEEYTFPGTKITIPKNTMIFIPIYAIHHDETIYPNSERFDPERFNEKCEFLAFGAGPKACIGERFAQNQTKVGIITAIRSFKFEVCEKTEMVYVKAKSSDLLSPKDGLYLSIKKL